MDSTHPEKGKLAIYGWALDSWSRLLWFCRI